MLVAVHGVYGPDDSRGHHPGNATHARLQWFNLRWVDLLRIRAFACNRHLRHADACFTVGKGHMEEAEFYGGAIGILHHVLVSHLVLEGCGAKSVANKDQDSKSFGYPLSEPVHNGAMAEPWRSHGQTYIFPL